MSLFASWLASSSPPSKRLLSRSQHELPRWTSEDAVTDSVQLPPPIATSLVIPTAELDRRRNVPDTLLALQKREYLLHEDLQGLLDAQAEGLVAGHGQPTFQDEASNGSSTPTAFGSRSSSRVSGSGKAARPPLGLRAARRGILKTIRHLVVIKDEEEHLLKDDISNNRATVRKLEDWSSKREGLERRIQQIEKGKAGSQKQELQEQADKLHSKIIDMEDRLADLKAKHRRILTELSSLDNSVQSKLSSYKTALLNLDESIQSFLIRPPLFTYKATPSASTLLSLPANRRTLSVAREYWQEQHKLVEKRRLNVQMEREALEEGAIVWDDVIQEVSDFERHLRNEMRSMNLYEQNSGHAESTLAALVVEMDRKIDQLHSKLTLAETRNWNLLVCCIGAELDAFKQGRKVLDSVLESTKDLSSKNSTELVDMKAPAHHGPLTGSVIHLSGQSSSTGGGIEGRRTHYFDTDDDDGPDPELLISHQEANTD